ncbi:MAG: hypothetical protein KIT87_02340 [Anaerolineae bacterium]|nr:hypothetical protein [Anaerolineae bacterium]
MRRRVALLVVLAALSLVWADWSGPSGGEALPLRAEPLANPGLIALRYQTGPLDTATLTPTARIGLPTPTQTPIPIRTLSPVQIVPPVQTVAPVQITPLFQTPLPVQTQRPGGLPPTIPPVVGTRGAAPLVTALATAGTGLPGAPALPGVTTAPGVATLPGLTASPTPPTATPTPGADGTRVVPTATVPLAGVRTFRGRIVQKDDTSLVIRVPNQGELTVSPGDDTDIRRDNVAATLAMLNLGDDATIVLGPNDEPLRLLVTTRSAEPEPAADATGVNVLTVIWQALLGLVMMGIVLIFDSELRTKFLAALLEPSSSYPYGRR